MKLKYCAAGLLTPFLFANVSNAQEGDTQNTALSLVDVERIEVVGQKPLTFYRSQFYRAEDNFVALFNQLSDNEDYTIVCEKRNRNAFSRIKKRTCESAFESKARSSILQRNIRSTGSLENFNNSRGVTGEVSTTLANMRKEQNAYTAELIENSPELAKAFIAYLNAKHVYDTKREEKWSGE